MNFDARLLLAAMAMALSSLAAMSQEDAIPAGEGVVVEVVTTTTRVIVPSKADAAKTSPVAEPAQTGVVEESSPPPEETTAEEQKPEEPPPPEPSEEDAADPHRLVHYFCKCWKDADYERMWWAMTPEYREEVTLEKFTTLFTKEKKRNGGVKDENLVLDDVELDDGAVLVYVDLRYKFKRAPVRRVKAEVEKVGTVYRLRKSGIIPLDFSKF